MSTSPATEPSPNSVRFDPETLVDVKEMMARVFSSESQPSLRFIKKMQKRRLIPYKKLGGRVFYNVPEVRAAIAKQTIQARP